MNTKKMNQVRLGVNTPADLADLERLLRSANESTITIKPDVAAAVLETWNGGNRRRDELTVQKYRRSMQEGAWQDGHEIGFGVFDDGIQLGNGQHRMGAQVASGTTQTYRVRVFTDAQDYGLYVITCDEGRVRSLSDVLQIFGASEGSGQAKRFEHVINSMQSFFGMMPTRLSKHERYRFAQGYIKPIRYVLGLPHRSFKAHVLGALALTHHKKPAVVEAVVSAAIGGEMLVGGSPAHVFNQSCGDWNDARTGKAKEFTMAKVMRLMHDAARGKSTTPKGGAPADGPMRHAVAFFCGDSVANDWLERMKKGAK